MDISYQRKHFVIGISGSTAAFLYLLTILHGSCAVLLAIMWSPIRNATLVNTGIPVLLKVPKQACKLLGISNHQDANLEMISRVSIGVSDLDGAIQFYDLALGIIGAKRSKQSERAKM